VNFFIGCTPAKLFQISTSRLPGHSAARAASSCGLEKLWALSFSSPTSSDDANTVMLLSLSMVKVLIAVPFSPSVAR
jgi:hypothetical protein